MADLEVADFDFDGDLDLVFSSKLRKQIEDENIELPKEIHPFPPNSDKFRFFG